VLCHHWRSSEAKRKIIILIKLISKCRVWTSGARSTGPGKPDRSLAPHSFISRGVKFGIPLVPKIYYSNLGFVDSLMMLNDLRWLIRILS
jgi:hypothetical protein